MSTEARFPKAYSQRKRRSLALSSNLLEPDSNFAGDSAAGPHGCEPGDRLVGRAAWGIATARIPNTDIKILAGGVCDGGRPIHAVVWCIRNIALYYFTMVPDNLDFNDFVSGLAVVGIVDLNIELECAWPREG
jgi:hypothetical protein